MRKLNKEEFSDLSGRRREESRSSLDKEPTRTIVVVPVRRGAGQAVTPAAAFPEGDSVGAVERIAEAVGLAKAIGLEVRYSGIIPLVNLRPATLLGTGKVEEIGAIVRAEKAAVVIVDHALTPVQQRNLEKAWQAKVLDRTGLILEIFADRARSKEGKLQVELARLTYQRSRLVRSWTHLERQRGGFGFLGGPGETQIEADRRAISERIDTIRGELGVIERTRQLHRKRRKARRQPVVSLVGYTNAGKSTLFNALSGADVLAKDMPFATLDPTLRRVELPDGRSFILSDTVGFISDLPTQLIAAFRATLEEILEADLILHVRDIASPVTAAHAAEVEKVLAEIGIGPDEYAKKVIEVWNKADLLPPEEQQRLANRAGANPVPAVIASAHTGEGLHQLIGLIGQRLSPKMCTREVVVDVKDGRLINWLYENTEILDRRDLEDGSLQFKVRVPFGEEGLLERRLQASPA